MRLISPSCVLLAFASSSAFALTNPFIESFSASSAGWSSASTFTAMNFVATGGVDNSGYATSNTSFTGVAAGAQPILARAQSNFNSSDNALFGNWIAGGVSQLSFSVRHNASVPVAYFLRFAPAAGPGAVALFTTPVQPNTWTLLDLSITAATPFIYEGTTFPVAFADVSRVQIGVIVDGNLAGLAGPFAFDVDSVAITPTPGAIAVLGVAGVMGARRRR